MLGPATKLQGSEDFMTNWHEMGRPITMDPEVMEAATLIKYLYEDLREGTGGPLHVILDDGNTSDYWVDEYRQNSATKYSYLWDDTWGKWHLDVWPDADGSHRRDIERTCDRILELFQEMPEAWRVAAIAHAHGEVRDYMLRISSRGGNSETV